MWSVENEGKGALEGGGTSLCLATPPEYRGKEDTEGREGGKKRKRQRAENEEACT